MGKWCIMLSLLLNIVSNVDHHFNGNFGICTAGEMCESVGILERERTRKFSTIRLMITCWRTQPMHAMGPRLTTKDVPTIHDGRQSPKRSTRGHFGCGLRRERHRESARPFRPSFLERAERHHELLHHLHFRDALKGLVGLVVLKMRVLEIQDLWSEGRARDYHVHQIWGRRH